MAENGLEAIEATLADPQKYDIIFMGNLRAYDGTVYF